MSDTIKPLKAVELVEAAQQAMAMGLPFNRHLTVHWAKAKLADHEAAAATGCMVKLLRDWVRKTGGTVVYAWVRENGPGKGTHSHILLHLPDGLTMAFTRRWYRLATRSRGKVPKGAVNSGRIGGTARAGFSASEWYQANLARLLSYLLKGADRATGTALGLTEYEEGGRIVGKRLGVSVHLPGPAECDGPTAAGGIA